MNGLMMDYPLTLQAILRRAQGFFGHKEIVSRQPDHHLHRYTYADLARRARRLAAALRGLGVGPGDRVGTLCWNHHQHLEAYFGIPLSGAVLHTLNLRLHPDELQYIASHAQDRLILADASLMPLLSRFRDRIPAKVVVIGGPALSQSGDGGDLDYEALLSSASPDTPLDEAPDEGQAAALCYTTGTTGRPKGVLYTHRSLVLHSMAIGMADVFGLSERDVVLPVVPMFHANAWGLPYAAALTGARLVLPGPHLDPQSLLSLLQDEQVTLTAGVPTIWLGMLQLLDKDPRAYDLSRLRTLVVGGSAAPASMIRGFAERHRLQVLHAWGMTEMTPLGTVAQLPSELLDAPAEQALSCRATQGRAAPFIEVRARSEQGPCPWDGTTMGELEVRGAWVASAYFDNPDETAQFTADGWFRTGDIVTIDGRGYIQIQDRKKDLIKSGGEWISSVALENALMGHPDVAEAAVIPVFHPRWQERPLAALVLKEGRTPSEALKDDLRRHLLAEFAPFWVPEHIEFVAQIPRTSAGKFNKTALREHFAIIFHAHV